jgi:phospholipase D1/2
MADVKNAQSLPVDNIDNNEKGASRLSSKSPNSLNGARLLSNSSPSTVDSRNQADERTDLPGDHDTLEPPPPTRTGNVVDQPIQEERESNDGTDHSLDGDPDLRPATSGSRQASMPGTSTPTGRRSVQFTRNTSDNEPQEPSRSRASSIAPDDVDPALKDRKQSLLTKLKAFAVSPSFPSHSRSASAATVSGGLDGYRNQAGLQSPGSEREEFRFPGALEEEGSEVDADAEESAGEQRTRLRTRRKMKKKQPRQTYADSNDPQTAPTTPRASNHPGLFSSSSFAPSERYRPSFFPRRGTSDFSPQPRDGVSEDEGRERLRMDTAWRRRSSAWLSSARGLTYSGRQEPNNPEEKRPSNFRRLTAFAGPSENAEGTGVPWRRHRAERGSSLSAQKWRQIKAGLKMIGQRRKTENTVDHVKSAELLAELTSGIPAALILASMFQRDEHGSRRIPILLEQLKVQITDSRIDSHSGDRHLVFRIELEYGSGMTRMKWIIHRTLKDFANLHLKYKLQIGTQKYIQLRHPDTGNALPRFPRSAFPYLRGVRGLDSDREDEEDDGGGYETGAEATSGNEKGRKTKKRRPPVAIPRRRSSLGNAQEGDEGISGTTGAGTAKKDSYPERQRRKLENYLQKMIRFLIFRPESNRLCKFLELSALGVRLAAEGSYHGKEGFLIIQSSKGLDFRKALTPSLIKKRYSPKWFLVRHSYVVCVDSPEEMNIYDVFLVDPFFKIQAQKVRLRDRKARELAQSAKESARHPQHHSFKLENSERKLRLLARNERQLHQFEDSIRFMVENTSWSKPNRFDSFAPVRQRCFAQWLVDGRDHMWLVSRAINQAKDVIYIHDWWLSPELYLRRPAAISQKWRLDRLLQRKAREGVKVFVIMYRNINSAIPIDSEYSKFSLLDLHPNIFVQRSPNQFRQNTFFWAHHEKVCIIDHTLAFVGGIDLCFGRWDTPQHAVTDDKPTGFETSETPKDADHCQLWPGKDYSNPRVQDFYDLDKPYEEMYDRNVVPRMPWHDISMHVVGQPARDLTRHFVQRWNYILRQRKPTRPTPFLLPPPDFNPADLEALGLDGTCEVQILRSSSTWSTGTPDITEHSIMNAYVKLIHESEHFVYIENQFFISTCDIDGKRIENLIGDALVERIVRAARNDEAWRAVILVPLMPGFQNTVDSEGGTSVRLIMQCQYRSICRGETSIFGRLRAQGIEPEDYIQFFSLRAWGTLGPQKQLVTEQLYIHAKCMIVDDRAVIIGSANINERSMLGSRDSECAAIVRDTDMLWSTMNDKPYLVGRFPHTLRMRLMREHLGIDVDELLEQDIATEAELRQRRGSERIDSESMTTQEKQDEREMIERRHRIQDEFLTRSEDMHSFNHDVDWEQANNPNLKANRKLTADPRVTDNVQHRKDVDGKGPDNMNTIVEAGLGDGRDSLLLSDDTEVMVSDIAPEGKGTIAKPRKIQRTPRQTEGEDAQERLSPPLPVEPETSIDSEEPLPSQLPPLPQMNDADIVHPGSSKEQTDSPQSSHPLARELKRPFVDENCMKDPVNDAFYYDVWLAVAENNTKIYRTVFRCMPDSEVKSWKEYKEYAAYGERFAEMQNHHIDKRQQNKHASKPPTGPPGAMVQDKLRPGKDGGRPTADPEAPKSSSGSKTDLPSPDEKSQNGSADSYGTQTETNRDKDERQSPLEEKAGSKGSDSKPSNAPQDGDNDPGVTDSEKTGEKDRSGTQSVGYSDTVNMNASSQPHRRRRRATTRGSKREFTAPDGVIDKHQAEELVNMVQGHLVMWPYDW